MKKTVIAAFAAACVVAACQKQDSSSISLSASATTVAPGQVVSVTANTSSANALSWSANPAATASGTYSITTEKTNYYTFSATGTYTIGVRARHLELDSVHHCDHLDSIGHHVEDSAWNHHIGELWHERGHDRGGCRNGVDSASVTITVK